MTAKELIQAYEISQRQWAKIGKEEGDLRNGLYMQQREIELEFLRKEGVIREEKYSALKHLDKEYFQSMEGLQPRKLDAISVIQRMRRIVAFLKVDASQKIEIEDDSVRQFDSRKSYYIQWEDTFLYEDEFFKIRLLVYDNGKPKNKYSLVAYGNILFPSSLIKIPHECGIWLKDSDFPYGRSLRKSLKDFPSLELLTQWKEKNKKNILSDVIKEYLECKREYLEVKELYSLEDFKGIEVEGL